MISRALLTLLLLFAPAARAAGTEGDRWHFVARSPRPGLPAVEVRVGYPGRYAPPTSTPIELLIRTGDRPFDGHVGFHVAADGRRTADTPVLTRVQLPPHAWQRFSTFLTMRTWGPVASHDFFSGRGVVIEWRDRSVRFISKAPAGIPRWDYPLRPLRIAFDGERLSSATYLGSEAAVIPARAMEASPQWYAGFSHIVLPLDGWKSLPAEVREAIFRSGVHVAFFGVPTGVPSLSAIDRAMLPIELTGAPGMLEAPWPWNAAGTQPRPVEVSWKARAGSLAAGAPALPFLVLNPISAFAADEEALRGPLPTIEMATLHGYEAEDSKVLRPRIPELIGEFPMLVLFIAASLLSIGTWLFIRRHPSPGVALVIGGLSLVLIAARGAISRPAGAFRSEAVVMLAPGVIKRATMVTDYGETPLRAPQPAVTAALAGRARAVPSKIAEVRTSGTPPGFGTLWDGPAWSAASRLWVNRELQAQGTKVRVSAMAGERLRVEFDADTPVDSVAGSWICGEHRCFGEARASGSKGEVVLRDHTTLWSGTPAIPFDVSTSLGMLRSGAVHVTLFSNRNQTLLASIHLDPPGSSPMVVPFRLGPAMLHGEGPVTAGFLLGSRPEDAEVRVMVRAFELGDRLADVTAVTLSGSGGAQRVEGTGLRRQPYVLAEFGDLRRIAPEGGVLIVTVESSSPVARQREASVIIRKRES